MKTRIDSEHTGFLSVQRHMADLLALTKPRLVVMILVTTVSGFYLGMPGELDWILLAQTALGVGLAAGGTLALNQYLERELDGLMTRTRRMTWPLRERC